MSAIFLIGFMGCGKTSIGKKIANRLNYSFIDIDQEISRQQNKSIPEIFIESGEDGFRELETNFVELIQKENIVYATGGGLPCFNNNIEILNQKGITIYLECPTKELFQRLKKSKEERPLIKSLNDEDLLRFIETTLSNRTKYYNQAKITCEISSQDVGFIVKTLESHQVHRKSH